MVRDSLLSQDAFTRLIWNSYLKEYRRYAPDRKRNGWTDGHTDGRRDGQCDYYMPTGPRSAVGNMSGNRCESDCRSRGREFDAGPVPYFRGD